MSAQLSVISPNPHLKSNLNTADYNNAIKTLLASAFEVNRTGYTCRAVLLMATFDCSIDIKFSYLAALETYLYSAALVIIRCRVELHQSPHQVLTGHNDSISLAALHNLRHFVMPAIGAQ